MRHKNSMKKIVGTLMLRLGGWTEDYPLNFAKEKCVMISAPHTAFRDFIFTIISFWKNDIDVKILFNDSEVTSLTYFFYKKITNRKKCRITKQAVNFSTNLLNNSNQLILIIPTECCIKRVEKWRTEFYDIAQKAKVPVALGFIDYSSKIIGVGNFFKPSGDKEKDLKKIENFYKNFEPKYSENYNPNIF